MINGNKEKISSPYCKKAYLSPGRLLAFVEQYMFVDEGDTVLEIGIGSGLFKQFVSTIAEYHSIDIDLNLKPDYVLNIANTKEISILPKIYNKIFCCQVLEHIPFEHAMTALKNIFSLNADIVCMSLPDNRNCFAFCVAMLRMSFKKIISIPFSGHKVDYNSHGQHYWELYSGNIQTIEKKMVHIGLQSNYYLFKQYRLFERSYQHFYIFKKKK